MTPLLNATLVTVALLLSVILGPYGEAVEKRWDQIIQELRR